MITKKWFSKICDKIFGYCEICDTNNYHKCVECDTEISKKTCDYSEGHCHDCGDCYQFNFG